MKTGGKPPSRKSRFATAREKERRHIIIAFFLVLILMLSVLSGYFIYTLFKSDENQSDVQPSAQFVPSGSHRKLKVAVIDQLNETASNPSFVQGLAEMLTRRGYTVDYYDTDKVTVDLYRKLPKYSYSIVILRVHSGFVEGGGNFTFLFSSEPYDHDKYVKEQLANELMIVRLRLDGPSYFGVNEEFIKSSMKDTFNKTVVIMMGCNGLTFTSMAEAFIKKGAGVYIGWEGAVGASYTDNATERLLHYLVEMEDEIGQAIKNAMQDVGNITTDDGMMAFYPIAVENRTLTNIGT